MNDLRDVLLGTMKRRLKTVEIEGVGEVRLRSLTEAERIKVVNSSDGEEMATLMVYSLIDDNGDRVFSEEELPLVLSLDAGYVRAISEQAREHCLPNLVKDSTTKNS